MIKIHGESAYFCRGNYLAAIALLTDWIYTYLGGLDETRVWGADFLIKLLIISFDAVGDHLFEELLRLKNFAAFAAQCTAARGVSSVFLTNTYPVHASVATGLSPGRHGVISNTEPFPGAFPRWNYHARRLKAVPLWKAAHSAGLRSAAVLWPVTGGAKEIRYNLPELMVQPGQSQLIENMREGSRFMQLRLWLRYGHLMNGLTQPDLDNFSTACMLNILKSHRPELAFMHWTAYDTLCHKYGEESAVKEALPALDKNLGLLLNAAGDGASVILFSDHAQIDLKHEILPNDILVGMGLLKKAPEKGYEEGATYIECCGGSAFMHPGRAGFDMLKEIRRRIQELEGFERFLTTDELLECGRPELPFGFCAKPGFSFEIFGKGEKGQHGYPRGYDNYGVFYMARGQYVPQGRSVSGGSLLDIAPIAVRLLSDMGHRLIMPDIGAAREDFFGLH
ncbi:MAG: ectonucleotide pyrophosphatase/phosphodiesterase [Oscillospiraceae bacterium]|nr:ectonucleotide pyrophosphatase/phosphodiesterase [Oscillospiraceae bacterium]